MGEMITLKAEDGHQLSAYRANPAGKPKGGLVIIQEIFGVNVHIKSVCDGFAADGYAAVAPAVFDRVERGVSMGYTQDDITRGRAIREKLGWDPMVMDVRAAVKALQHDKLKVGVVGYCMGGSLTWLAATRIAGLAAAVSYYGGAVADFSGEQPRCPVLFHFGETDQSIPQEHWDRIRAAHPTLPMHIYTVAGHGFNCDMRASYHEASARLARQRTLDFLKRHLG
ncbi:MAG: dienelactone hydrolase family protein [Candidatus Rokubacteria bacterium]|nr:dienelactone hydrolase family protein [Candidatus Rokubacteria bacterium]